MKKISAGKELSKILGISRARGMEAVIKAQLISAILEAVGLTAQVKIRRAA